ncbi:MAG: DUF1553 domain-containing protein [Fuerstiella sp.]|nr:DUF1553 domain-containing protein [Fuerstiella sp.]
MRNDFVFVCICTLLAAGISVADDAKSVEHIRFNEHIRPILSEYCFACHGPDSGSRKGELRLDVREAAIDSGAVTAGDSENSELIARITSDDPELVMPPPDSRKTLNPEHKQLLIQWINEGAAFEKHWSFIKPQRASVPKAAGNEEWSANAIDHFILQKLDGLKPNAAADRHVLARRAALDVTGLPPTPEMLQAFIADSSGDAWSNYIDRLLKSEHSGEHRARYWLDAARYGDTHGMHVDNYREMWPYRDWVVRAFNANMPFDRFVVEQLAGDLLPEPTQDQLIATGFSRCNITTSEGGAIPAEVAVRYMVDRVETTATVFLGLTAGCAVCHDHKYDPISQREFYQLGAFFNNTTTPAMDGNQKDTPPVVTLPSDEFAQEWHDLRSQRTRLGNEFDVLSADVAAWWPKRNRDVAHPVSADELLASLPLTEGEAVTPPDSASWATEHPAGRRGIRFGEKGQLNADLPSLRTDEPLSISFWYRTPERLMSTTVFDQTAKTEDKKTIGWKIAGNTQGGLTFEFNDGQGKKIRALLPGEEALTPRAWQHVCVRYSGGQSNSSITILVNGRAGVLRNSTENLMGAAEVPAGVLRIASRLPTAGLSDIRVYRRWLTDEETRLLGQEHTLNTIMQSDATWDSLDKEQQQAVTLFHRATINADGAAKLREYATSQQRRDFIYSRSTTTLVMQERPSNPKAWVLERGEYDQRREEVAPWIPDVLNFPGTGFRAADGGSGTELAGRLDLARWLVHPDHPLTARVMVNRLWQSAFGTGLVKTSEDFGVMGDRPSHPELLDWLAVELVESGWNVNHILKLILTSSTYRQSGAMTAEKLARDSDNRYFARGPRIRLDAEVLRDQVLAVSGLLRRDIGGPSVKPYQPAGLWKVVAITGSNTRIFSRDTGDALYRRSVYSFWKRTAPPPSMAAFNAPTREQCTVRRERTNTPIQALVLMNDPQYVESARRLAENAIRQEADDQARAEWMLSTVLSRPAKAVNVAEITAAASEFQTTFRQKPEAAKELINTGDTKPDETLDTAELAAWTLVANTLMNRDDFISK